MNVGEVIAKFKADITNFQQGVNSVKNSMSNLGSGFKSFGTGVQSVFSSVGKGIVSSIGTAIQQAQMVAVGALAIIGFNLSKVTGFFSDASQEAESFAKAMTTLDIIAGRFGESGAKAQKVAQDLSNELNIGVGASAEGIQNLLKSGLNLDQASDLMKRFTNEAITGKSPMISLTQAVQNLAFAYQTENSMLGNMSGVSENFGDIIERGKKALIEEGVAVGDITREMAKYRGMIDLTNLTMGSSERFTNSLTVAQAKFDKKILDTKIAIGNGLNPVLADLFNFMTKKLNPEGTAEGFKPLISIFESLSQSAKDIMNSPAFGMLLDSFKAFGEWVKNNQQTVIAFIQGLGIAIAGLTIVGTISLLLNPIALVIGAIALLWTAWQTNFLGIRDITANIIGFISGLWTKYGDDVMYIVSGIQKFVMAVFGELQKWWANWGSTVMAIVNLAWSVIGGAFKLWLTVIFNAVKFFIAVFQGDWGKAFESIQAITKAGQEFIEGVFNSLKTVVLEALKGMFNSMTEWLNKMWDSAKNIAKNIREAIASAFDVKKRNSPSILDRINDVVSTANEGLKKVTIPSFSSEIAGAFANITPNIAGISNGQVAGSNNITQNVYANVSDKVDIDSLSQRLAFNLRNTI